MRVVSTMEGQREGITTVGNHFFPPPTWGFGHAQGLETVQASVHSVLGLDPGATALLLTGADMDNLAVARQSFREMTVTALVTAGVMSNAMRMGADPGLYYELDDRDAARTPGTVNILLLTNLHLSPRAMTRDLITATEAKSAALQDLDIRSSASPGPHQATGTGTDNIIVVEGSGQEVDSSDGHTRLGELVARAVYEGVQQAVHQQNGVVQNRSIFQRLREREIDLSTAVPAELRADLEHLLLQPYYAAFMESTLAVSDARARRLVTDPAPFRNWCAQVASRVAGRPVVLTQTSAEAEEGTLVHSALKALVDGLAARVPASTGKER
jgi:adenosylcobinamide amidohydrolase